MPSLSASSQSNAWTRGRARAAWPMIACIAALCASACRDTREDANYCSTCASGETAESVNTDMSVQEGAMAAPSSDGPNSTAKTGPSMMSTIPAQAGAGRAAQGAAAVSGAGNVNSGGTATAGTRAGQAGTAARSGGNANSGSGGRTAANGGNVSAPMRDAGAGGPEPTLDAGNPAPMPCNGSCPPQIPVCDETKSPAECVQCSGEDQRECTGATKTCDLEQNKCVQCTVNDTRDCPRDTPVCNAENRCVRCTSDNVDSCPAAQPICIDENRCVECRTNNDCRDGTRNMCNTDGVCVTCMTDAQCMDPANPRCDATTNGCVGCEASSDCAGRFPGTPLCDKQKKRCVACVPDSDMLCEAGFLCDANSNTCVSGMPNRKNCDTCMLDSECAQSPSIAACIDHEGGKRCFATAPGAMPRCEPGYMPATVQGRTHFYCMPISPATCQSIADAISEKMCTTLQDCGKGGQCPAPDLHCRLSCSPNAPETCPAPLVCDGQNRVCKKR
ncbi:MAG TPA: hypothetical protein VFN67_28020 [Polyangiales bacterium]|nr:hypothetical protein [Polyangiales bacterium]